MLFTIRDGDDPVARADATLLRALGLPSGGVLRVRDTHVLVKGADMAEPTALAIGEQGRVNAGIRIGSSVDATRAVLSPASVVVLGGDELPGSPIQLINALKGRPVTVGDTVTIDAAYLDRSDQASITVEILDVSPNPAGTIGPSTRFTTAAGPSPTQTRPSAKRAPSNDQPTGKRVITTSEALLAGLDDQLDLLSGWLSLLTSPRDLPAAWGLPAVAGVLLEGPPGCGKPELVHAAAAAAGTRVHTVDVDMVFKPDRLLDLLEQAARQQSTPVVIFVDRLEAVAGDEGMTSFRTQITAILRWFLDAVADTAGMACVLGVDGQSHLDRAITRSPLLPRSLSIPPPDLTRRSLLFESALAKVPSEELDHDLFASRSAGFSGADVLACVVHASARVAMSSRPVTNADVLAAIEETAPSLGSMSMGDVPSFGFEAVANLVDAKRRLTEAVIWPVTDPERFRAIGIEPPRGILLYGPPGTGKTYVVRALAHEAGAAFFSVKGAELLDKYVGESERGVRDVFGRARAAAPSIIFFDEFDALAPVRGRSSTTVTDSVVAALLTEIDGVGERGDVAVIAATNRRDLIDPALLRAGRFEIQIELGLPAEESRRALLDISDVPFGDDVDLDRLAAETDGMSFADLAGVLREAALEALRSDHSATIVTWPHLQIAITRWNTR